MENITELFGIYCKDSSADFSEILSEQKCPFRNKVCTKNRKSNPDIKIGTCSVKHQQKDIIICPHRLLDKNQIFLDCLHLLTLHEPGNLLYLIPEVSITGGVIDYFLVSAKDGKVLDFVGIELQTVDTTGTIWPSRQAFLQAKGIPANPDETIKPRPFGMNWKMSAKTILVQMHHKGETFERLNKHLVLIIQDPFFERMRRDFNFSGFQTARLGDLIHIHSYAFQEGQDKMQLQLSSRVSTDTAGISKSLGYNAKIKLELHDILTILESKLSDDFRLTPNL